MRAGDVDVLVAMGGTSPSAAPDTGLTAEALRRLRLAVHVLTKLNRSYLATGETALILPCLARTDLDVQATGDQFVSDEDSMGIVQGASDGCTRRRPPAVRAGDSCWAWPPPP